MRISDWSSDVCSSDLRKVKKRSFRALWIQRINAAVRAEGLTYSQFMHGVKLAGIELDRKVMADLAMNEGGVFTAIIAQAKEIGRASCRERVLSYVLISVGVVTFKTNKCGIT